MFKVLISTRKKIHVISYLELHSFCCTFDNSNIHLFSGLCNYHGESFIPNLLFDRQILTIPPPTYPATSLPVPFKQQRPIINTLEWHQFPESGWLRNIIELSAEDGIYKKKLTLKPVMVIKLWLFRRGVCIDTPDSPRAAITLQTTWTAGGYVFYHTSIPGATFTNID